MINTTILPKIQITYLAKFLILLTVATAAPVLGSHSQWITGPIVNAALILSVFLVGVRGTLLIGMLPSTIALSTGLLPPVMAPMIPFIIVANSIFVLVIDQFRKVIMNNELRIMNYAIGLVIASVLKFLFLYLTTGLVINLLLNQAVADKVATMMSWPQMATAMMGGALAWFVLKFYDKKFKT